MKLNKQLNNIFQLHIELQQWLFGMPLFSPWFRGRVVEMIEVWNTFFYSHFLTHMPFFTHLLFVCLFVDELPFEYYYYYLLCHKISFAVQGASYHIKLKYTLPVW